jgi:hypothetical protein
MTTVYFIRHAEPMRNETTLGKGWVDASFPLTNIAYMVETGYFVREELEILKDKL